MKILNQAINFLLPQKCDVCGALLGELNSTMLNMKSPVCSKCLQKIVPLCPDRRWFLCLSEPFSGDPYPTLTLYMPFVYAGFFERAIPAIKFSRKRELAFFLGGVLAGLMSCDGVSGDIIIPIPLSKERLTERGFNQAEVLSLKISEYLKIPLVTDCLIRNRNTMRQTGINDKYMRSSNVEGAFSVMETWVLTGLNIILIDDVATTGNTLHEAATMLLKKGARQVVCVALAGNRAYKNAESY